VIPAPEPALKPTLYRLGLGPIFRDYVLYETNRPQDHDHSLTLTLRSPADLDRALLLHERTRLILVARRSEVWQIGPADPDFWTVPSAALTEDEISDLLYAALVAAFRRMG
jgi:hypothetical protein